MGTTAVTTTLGADRAIIVTTPEVSALRDADRIIGLCEAAELPEPMLIVNRFRAKLVKRGDMLNKEDILDILAIPLIGMVPDHEDVIVTSNKGYPAAFDEKSIVGEAYRRIARRITGETDVPFVATEEPDTMWTVMKRWMGFSKEVAS